MVKNVIFWQFEVIFGHLSSFWAIFESEMSTLKIETNIFWSFLRKNRIFIIFILKTAFKAELDIFSINFRLFWIFYPSYPALWILYPSFQTFFKRDFGLSWILISQNLFSESKVRAFNSLIVFLSFYWHLRILWISDSTVLWDFRIKIAHFRVKMGHFWWISLQIGSKLLIWWILAKIG